MAITAGQKLTSARLTTQACRARRSTTLSLTSGTITPITFDVDSFDNSSIFGPPSTALTLPTAGLWGILAYGGFASNATGLRRLLVEIGSTGTYPTIDERMAVSGDATHITLAGTYVASAGDILRLAAHQTSGGALNLLADAYFSVWLIES
ncbi:hypothetical protein V6U81_04420 [Micromonospora sp. CPCC 205711]|uniref:hypothetical protein n=1 Tax=Micromonospora sp. CPCC 205547 TaxID=3122400 RepID=UPI002FF122A7